MNEDKKDLTAKKSPDKTLSPAPAPPSGEVARGKAGIMKIISGLLSGLVLRQGKHDKTGAQTGDTATQLANQRTDLAMERNYLAVDRTLMAWIRTALSMISFGFTIGKLGQVMGSVEVKGVLGSTKMMSVESIAYFLVIMGTVALFMAAIQHWVRVHQLYEMGLSHQLSISFFVALLLIMVGGFALSSLVLAL